MLLTCQDIPQLAGGVSGGNLPLHLRLGLGLHLAQCRACRAYLRGLRRVSDLARQSFRGARAPEALLRRLGLAEDDGTRDAPGPDRANDPPLQERADDDPPRSRPFRPGPQSGSGSLGSAGERWPDGAAPGPGGRPNAADDNAGS